MLHDFPRNMLIVVLVNAFNDIISVFAVLHFDNDLIPGLQFILYNGKITEFAAVSIVPRKDNVAACYGHGTENVRLPFRRANCIRRDPRGRLYHIAENKRIRAHNRK